MSTRKLGRFVLVERVAQGGMGEIYRGVDAGIGGVERPVAIKLILPELADSERHVEDFLSEAKLSFLISHPNVVQLLDAGRADDVYFMAMEWIEGTDLSVIKRQLAIRGQRMPLPLAVHVATEAARGLDYAHRLRDASGHSLKLVHRDVSPSNILISFEGAVKISDFGIAKSRLRPGGTQVGRVKGKLGYMAPEQARGEAVDHRADVFSLGVVLFELATGKNPFTDGATDAEVLMRVQQCVYRPPRALMPEIPPGLEALLLRALVSDPAARYATAGALRDDLEQLAQSEGYRQSTSELSRFVHELMGRAPAPSTETGTLTRLERGPAQPPGPTPTWPPAGTLTEQDVGRGGKRKWGVAVAALLVGATAWWGWRAAHRPAPGPTTPPAPPSASLPPQAVLPAAPASPDPPPLSHPAAAPPSPRRVVKATQLTVVTDVSAMVFVDGHSMGEAPVRATSLTPGHHVIRAVDLNRGGMRHLPVEREVNLKPGESRQLDLAFE